MTDKPLPNRLNPPRDWLAGLLLAAAFAVCAVVSWRTWPDLLVDFGQELYVPWRLAAGDVLYRDIAWVTGPLPQYFNSLLFRIFGDALTTLIVANLIVLAAIIAMLYRILRECGTCWSATVGCLFFITVFAFAQYSLIGNYNYLCPYRHDVTHGMALGLANLLCLRRFGAKQSWAWLAASGFCLGLILLTKVEFVLASGLATAASFLLFAGRKPSREQIPEKPTNRVTALTQIAPMIRDVSRWSGVVVVSAAIPVGIAVAWLAWPLGWSAACSHLFLQYRLTLSPQLAANTGFYRAVSGWDHPLANVTEMVLMAVILLAAAIIGVVLERILGESPRSRLWAAVVGILAAVLGLLFVTRENWESVPMTLPLALPIVALVSFGRARKSGGTSDAMLFLWAAYSLGLLPKIALRAMWGHYGFVLAMPGTLVLIHMALHSIPGHLFGGRSPGNQFRAFASGLTIACALSMMSIWARIDQVKTTPMGENGDRFYVDAQYDTRALPTLRTLSYLRKHLQPGETLAVFPNGVMLNYLLRARNPSGFIMFSPWESDVHGGEDHVAEAVIRSDPDYAVIVSMDLTIHGRGNFGSPEFGGRILEFLKSNYDVVDHQASRGGAEASFFSVVFKRRSAAK